MITHFSSRRFWLIYFDQIMANVPESPIVPWVDVLVATRAEVEAPFVFRNTVDVADANDYRIAVCLALCNDFGPPILLLFT